VLDEQENEKKERPRAMTPTSCSFEKVFTMVPPRAPSRSRGCLLQPRCQI
jgi:hypothetical protein